MDIHPLVVHFPVALLTVYSLLELARLPAITRQPWLFYTKAVLLLVGFAGGLAALQTGEIAQQPFLNTPTMRIISLHEQFANMCMVVYGLLAGSYAVQWARRDGLYLRLPPLLKSAWSVVSAVEHAVFRWPVLVIGAAVGFVLLSFVGALGGAIAYGPDVDPAVSFVYHLFFTE